MVTIYHMVVPILPVATPMILNSVLNHQNDTFKKSLFFEIEYFFDVDKYFMIPFLHLYSVMAFSGIVSGALGNTYIVAMYHLIGRFDAIG